MHPALDGLRPEIQRQLFPVFAQQRRTANANLNHVRKKRWQRRSRYQLTFGIRLVLRV